MDIYVNKQIRKKEIRKTLGIITKKRKNTEKNC